MKCHSQFEISTGGEHSPKVGRKDPDLTEMDGFEVWSGCSEPRVDFHAAEDLGVRGEEAALGEEEPAAGGRTGPRRRATRPPGGGTSERRRSRAAQRRSA